MIETRRVHSDFLVPRNIDGYIDVGLSGLLSKLAWGRPLILRGPKDRVKRWPSSNGPAQRVYLWFAKTAPKKLLYAS
jgi:hypothetical protein